MNRLRVLCALLALTVLSASAQTQPDAGYVSTQLGTINTLPMWVQTKAGSQSGTWVLGNSNLQDNGTQLLYKGNPIGSGSGGVWGSITGTLSSQTDLQTALNAKVPTTTTVNGHALSANVIISASDLTTGTLPHAQLPALVSGDIPNNAANTSGTAGGLSGTPSISVQNLTVNGTCTGCSAGSGITLQTNTANNASQAILNLLNSSTNAVGLSITITNISSGNVQLEITGGSYSGNAATSSSAAKWTTARALAGNSTDGSANVPFANKFIVQGTSDSGLSGAQFLGALATGPLCNTTTTGALTACSVTGTGSVVQSASPTLTGVPIAPTAAPGTNTTQIATTAFVLANGGSSGFPITIGSTSIAASSATTTINGMLGLGFVNATSGSISIAAPTGALGTQTLTLPDETGTLLAAQSGSFIMGSGTSSNTDGIGELTVSGATSIGYTFINTYTSHPECYAEVQGTTALATSISYTGTTAMTINFPSSFTGTVSYHCDMRN